MGPPAADPTTILTGLTGYDCPKAVAESAVATTIANQQQMSWMRLMAGARETLRRKIVITSAWSRKLSGAHWPRYTKTMPPLIGMVWPVM